MIDSKNNNNNHYTINIINSQFKLWHNTDTSAAGSVLHLTPSGTININSSNI